MKVTINKIYEFVTKLVILLDTELENLKNTRNTIATKKNIADILNKLVSLLAQLDKITKNTQFETETDISQSDQEILNQFIEKIKLDIKQQNDK